MLQALLCCPQFNTSMFQLRDKFKENKLVSMYCDLFSKGTTSESIVLELGRYLAETDAYKQYNGACRQEDVTETFFMFLHAINSEFSKHDFKHKNIHLLFESRYETDAACSLCESEYSLHSNTEDVSFLISEPGRCNEMGVNKYLLSRNEPDAPGYKCAKCSNRNCVSFTTFLVKIPPIVMLVYDRLAHGVKLELPSVLTFPASNGGEFVYKPVAQVLHAGSRSGGHYITKGKRDQWYIFNDESVSPTDSRLQTDAYVTIYCFEKKN